jgi:hypothetical protein
MRISAIPQWFVSDNVCALCDHDRHLAHIVRQGSQWFAFDATRPNPEGLGCLFLGSFARSLTAMEFAQSETLKIPARVSCRPVSTASRHFRNLPVEMPHDSGKALRLVPRRAMAAHR